MRDVGKPASPEPFAEPLAGFRRWGNERGRLYSGIFTGAGFVADPALSLPASRLAPPPWPRHRDRAARCLAVGGHRAPHPRCRCGYYAYYRLPEELEDAAPEAVWGAVVAWGRIVECERGFRAQYARPVALLELEGSLGRAKRERLALAAENYGIPLLGRDELIAYAAWHGEVRP
jgi:hypothetical protein